MNQVWGKPRPLRGAAWLYPILVFGAMAPPAAAGTPWQLTSAACPQPATPLSLVKDHKDPETATVSELGQTAQLDIASAYAPQANAVGGSWCARYEITNNGPDTVPVIWWPLAGLEVKPSEPRSPPSPDSTITTLPPGRPPIVKNTDVYAFRSQTVHTSAYQSAAAEQPARVFLAASSTGADLPDTSGQPIVITMGDRRSLPQIGAEFTGGRADVGATSTVTRDDKGYTFTVFVGRNDEDFVQSVSAPFARALTLRGVSPDALPEATAKYRAEPRPLALTRNEYQSSFQVPAEPGTQLHIYLIRQPIVLQRQDGQVCFLAPAYSPAPMPESFQSCR